MTTPNYSRERARQEQEELHRRTTPNYSDPAIALRELVRATRLLLATLDISEMAPSIQAEQAVEDARQAVQSAMEGIWKARVAIEFARRDVRFPIMDVSL